MPTSRRVLLTEVSAAEFADQGYDGASLNTIIKRCSMSKSSFYYLFESKEELFDFVVRELLGRMTAAVAIPSPDEFSGGDFWSRMEGLFVEFTQAAGRDESLLNLGRMFYSTAPAAARGSVFETLVRAQHWVQAVLQAGRASGAVRDDLPESLQGELAFGMLRIFDQWSLTHLDESGAQPVMAAQFATLRRLLATSA